MDRICSAKFATNCVVLFATSKQLFASTISTPIISLFFNKSYRHVNVSLYAAPLISLDAVPGAKIGSKKSTSNEM